MKWSALIILLLGLQACGPVATEESGRSEAPNIVLLFADDYTYNALAAAGNTVIETPNLDRLARSGTSFSHAYNMGGWNGAICIASRSMIISGRTLWNAKNVEERWVAGDPTARQQTWGKVMENSGYATYMTGKWHVKVPADSIFQVTRHIRPGMPPDRWTTSPGLWRRIKEAYDKGEDYASLMPVGYHRPDSQHNQWDAADTTFGGFWSGGTHWSEVVANDAKDYIRDASASEQPFFLYLAFNAPHDPRQAPQSYLDRYPLDSIPAPDNWLAEYPDKDVMGCDPSLRDEALAPYPRTAEAIRTHIKEYYALISHLDTQIGEIITALEEAGELDNTYVMFTADHGLSVGRHGLLGKQNMYEHSMRVPLIVSGPGVSANAVINQPVYLQDVVPTSMELANIAIPDFVEFNSLVPLMTGDNKQSRYSNGVYGAYMKLQRMFIRENFKLVLYPEGPTVKLFDLENDPLETVNLAELPEQQDRVKVLFRELVNRQQEFNDSLDLRIIYPQFN